MPRRKPKSPTRLTRNAFRLAKIADRPLVPEADQQVGDQADRLPAEEQLQEVVGHHQHQHREGEQRDVAEEALVARVVVHVADGVDVHHQRHEGDDHHHHRGQAVDQEADLEAAARRSPPRCRPPVERLGAVHHRAPEDDQRESTQRHRHAQDGDPVRAGPADLACGTGRRRWPRAGAPARWPGTHSSISSTRPQPFRRVRSSTLMRAPVAEQHHQDGQADGRLGRRDRQDEEHEDLARRVTEEVREGDEVDVDRRAASARRTSAAG